MKSLFDSTSVDCSKLVTHAYSTSFSIGIKLLHPKFRNDIYAIYGFVRYADEIVDTFHDFNKSYLLQKFKEDTFVAIEQGISLNPILNSFQHTVNKYQIDHDLIHTFLNSMEMDLDTKSHDLTSFKQYILGSAEVVGLMCLTVFVEGNKNKYESLKEGAIRLGAAFQKVNFLRDLNADVNNLGRIYFPELQSKQLTAIDKKIIEESIEEDFAHALEGIKKLPASSKLGVYVAYKYYISLLRKIKNTAPDKLLETRIRVPNAQKISLLARSYVRYNLNLF